MDCFARLKHFDWVSRTGNKRTVIQLYSDFYALKEKGRKMAGHF